MATDRTPLVALDSSDPGDALSDDEFDAQVLGDWLEWMVTQGDPDDELWRNPPPAAWVPGHDYADVSANPEAWRLLRDSGRLAALDLTLDEALALAPNARAPQT